MYFYFLASTLILLRFFDSTPFYPLASLISSPLFCSILTTLLPIYPLCPPSLSLSLSLSLSFPSLLIPCCLLSISSFISHFPCISALLLYLNHITLLLASNLSSLLYILLFLSLLSSCSALNIGHVIFTLEGIQAAKPPP